LRKYPIIFIFILLLLPLSASGACDSTQSTLSNLNTAIAAASAGDEICLTDGTYSNFSTQGSPIDIQNTSGTSGNEIIVRPETVGGVTFNGTFHMNIGTSADDSKGKYFIIKDFIWDNIDVTGVTIKGIYVYADNVRITNCSFTDFGDSGDNEAGSIVYFGTGAADGELDYCTFDTWERVYVVSSEGMRFHMHHCYLTNPTNNTGHGIELGGDGVFDTDFNMIVEYNYFYKVNGAFTALSNKTSSATFRYNIFDQSEDFVLRKGEDNVVDTNYFLNSIGNNATIRIFDAGHKVINNYIIGAPSGYVAIDISGDLGNPSSYQEVTNLHLGSNTIIDSATVGIGIGYCGSSCDDPDTITLENNLIDQAAGTLIRLYNGTNITATTNTCNNYSTATYENGGDYCTTEETSTALSDDGYVYRLSATQDDGTADGNVTDDFDGTARGASPDCGCDEYPGDAVNYIQPTETGVSWNRLTIADPTPQGSGIAISADLHFTKPLDQTDCDIFYDCTDGTTKVVDGADVETYEIPGDLAFLTTCYWSVVVNPDAEAITNGPYTFITTTGPPAPTAGLATCLYNSLGLTGSYDDQGLTVGE